MQEGEGKREGGRNIRAKVQRESEREGQVIKTERERKERRSGSSAVKPQTL